MTPEHPDRPVLALETSGRAMSVALWGPAGLVAARHVVDGVRHGVALAPMIREVLAEPRLRVADLSAVAASLGPGSWTGLRIGLAAAKALAWAGQIGLVGVPSFEAMAHAFFRSPASRSPESGAGPVLLTVRSAYSEGLYLALFREAAGKAEQLTPECVVKPEDVTALVASQAGPARVCVCGEKSCLELLRGAAETAGWRSVEGFDEIPAEALAECAWARMVGQAFLPVATDRNVCPTGVWRAAAEIHRAAPLYLRASDPELKLRRRTGGGQG